MKIAVLQFSPELGQVERNIANANAILAQTSLNVSRDGQPLWLVLPELAFTGYNFKSLDEIEPFLEVTASGPSAQWAISIARKDNCFVTVGYPEKAIPPGHVPDGEAPLPFTNYNSTVTVAPTGQVVAHYRKRHLYYTDETWASEGDGETFYADTMEHLGPVAMGICMDLNPYRFTGAEWNKYEFANHVLESRSQLAVVSMAWLSRLTLQELGELPLRPDTATFSYWIERLFPLQHQRGLPVYVVLANRCGAEGEACYAGTSTVLCFRDGKGYIYDLLGKAEQKCMIVDLQKAPKYELQDTSVLARQE